MVISVFKAVLIIVILGVMVLILLGINHLFAGNFDADEDDAAELRKDLDERKDVISDQSVFHDLVKDSSKSKRRTTGGFSANAH